MNETIHVHIYESIYGSVFLQPTEEQVRTQEGWMGGIGEGMVMGTMRYDVGR